jgi:hypothetical protein
MSKDSMWRVETKLGLIVPPHWLDRTIFCGFLLYPLDDLLLDVGVYNIHWLWWLNKLHKTTNGMVLSILYASQTQIWVDQKKYLFCKHSWILNLLFLIIKLPQTAHPKFWV